MHGAIPVLIKVGGMPGKKPIRILHIITRMEEGGAPRMLLGLFSRLDKAEFVQHLASGPSPTGNDLLFDAGEMGMTIYKIPTLARNPNPLQDIRSLVFLIALIKEGTYDIIHTHTSKAGFIGRLAAHRAGKRRVIYSPHGNIFTGYFSRPETWVYTLMERAAARWCSRIVTLSGIGAEQFLAKKIGKRAHYRPIPNGIDISSFVTAKNRSGARRELGWGKQDIGIAAVGRLEVIKGHRDLVAAAPHIVDGLKNIGFVRFLIVGDGPEMASLQAKVLRLGLAKRFSFVGFRKDVAYLLSAADLLAMPSLNEGMGLSIVEAMVLSLPVVATDVGGISDVVEDGVTGILVPPREPKSLANSCVDILKDPKRAMSMGHAGKKRAMAYFDIERMIRSYASLYRELMREGI